MVNFFEGKDGVVMFSNGAVIYKATDVHKGLHPKEWQDFINPPEHGPTIEAVVEENAKLKKENAALRKKVKNGK